MIVDLDGLEFIDSSGLQCLLRAAQRSRADGDRLRIIEPEGSVGRLLGLTNARAALPTIPRLP